MEQSFKKFSFMPLFRNFLIVSTLLLAFGTNAVMTVRGVIALYANAPYTALAGGIALELGKLVLIFMLNVKARMFKIHQRLFIILVIALLTLGTLVKGYGGWTQAYAESAKDYKTLDADLASLKKAEQFLTEDLDRNDKNAAGLPANYVTSRKNLHEDSRKIEERRKRNQEEQARLERQRIAEECKVGAVLVTAKDFGWNEKLVSRGYNLFFTILLELLVFALVDIYISQGTKSQFAAHPKSRSSVDTGSFRNAALQTKPAKNQNATFGQKAKSGQILPKAAEEQADIRERNSRMMAILNRHGLTAVDVANLIGRKKVATVQAWMDGQRGVPYKVLLFLRKWADAKERHMLSSADLANPEKMAGKGNGQNSQHSGPSNLFLQSKDAGPE